MQFVAPNFDIGEVIAARSVETYFQPIISVRRKSIIGIEALSRGVDLNGSLVAPLALFEAAAAADLTAELDRVCRARSFANFLPLHRQNPELILFVNLHPATYDLDTDWMIEIVRDIGLDPRNIALEILENEFDDVRVLRRATERYKENGFLIAVDDMGVGHSNLDRIAELKPDIIKADLSLLRDIDREYHKQEIFKSLVHLSERIGGWVICEGIETESEALCALQLGGDLAQGYYFAKPHKPANDRVALDWRSVETIGAAFKAQMLDRIKTETWHRDDRRDIARRIAQQLENQPTAEFDRKLLEYVGQFPNLESACVLNHAGIQISDTIFSADRLEKRKTIIFRPPPRGTDHSLKEYYYVPHDTGAQMYETTPYVPLPSGSLCITVSSVFQNAAGEQCILCLHFDGLSHLQFGLYPEASNVTAGLVN